MSEEFNYRDQILTLPSFSEIGHYTKTRYTTSYRHLWISTVLFEYFL